MFGGASNSSFPIRCAVEEKKLPHLECRNSIHVDVKDWETFVQRSRIFLKANNGIVGFVIRNLIKEDIFFEEK